MRFFSKLFLVCVIILGINFASLEITKAETFPSYEDGLKATEFNSSKLTANNVIIEFIKFFLGFLAALAVLILIINGFILMTSGGDESRAGVAKSWIVYAIIGLIIVLLAWVIVKIIVTLSGIK